MEPIRKIPQQEIPKPLSGTEVASMVEKCYGQIPLELGCKLVESNIVLTLAGLKPKTEFFTGCPTEESLETLRKGVEILNFLLSHREIRFRFVGEPFNKPTGKRDKRQMIAVENLLGFERISKMTKIPGIHVFEAKEGFDGLSSWRRRYLENLEQSQAEGRISQEYDLNDMIIGVERGYPDQAILDFCDWLSKRRHGKLQDSEIPHTGTYWQAQPNYDFYPEHANDSKIVENIRQAGEILGDFYASSWHQRVSKDPDFIREREKEK